MLGEKIDELFKLRAEIDSISSQLARMKEAEEAIREEIIQLMDDVDIAKASSVLGTVSKKVELYPSIKDKQSFIEFCHVTGNTELMISQCNRAAFRTYYEQNNEYPPGIDAYEKSTLSVRKA